MPRPRVLVLWSLARQDRRSADLARRHGALGLLMAAEQLDDVLVPTQRAEADSPDAMAALDILWRTLHPTGRPTVHWNPATAHLRQAEHVRRWARVTGVHDHDALLRHARGLAADEFLRARTGPAFTPRVPVVPSS